ncbi:hypothetical protein Micbo1qcDRAFT_207848 [Microdochium bolleyi]|uniref:Major facilitator superfamily transporter n=1 Tax=Microdochium bolleyi TaxID=196109 RepID=A0A136IS75_9PEZI|nr:hypothetical protein Micbo1qcDRAFT_207848 [Microdochium bolleyi]
MLAPLSRRGLLRPKALAALTMVLVVIYLLATRGTTSDFDSRPQDLRLNHGSKPNYNGRPSNPGKAGSISGQGAHNEVDGTKLVQPVVDSQAEADTGSSTHKDHDNQLWENMIINQSSPVRKMTADQMKKQWKAEYEYLADRPGYGAIYGNTLASLDFKKLSHTSNEAHLTPTREKPIYSVDEPYVYNPYPEYNGKEWLKKHAQAVACDGPGGKPLEDIKVFQGHPHNFPEPGFGSYEALGLDGNLCFERETRLGLYGLDSASQTEEEALQRAAKWDKVNWGELQEACVSKNKARFELKGKKNPYLNSVYRKRSVVDSAADEAKAGDKFTFRRSHLSSQARRSAKRSQLHTRRSTDSDDEPTTGQAEHSSAIKKEERTALLLRTYTGKTYSENDKQVIRSLISELSLRTGGRYQVYLFVHVKDTAYAIWDDATTYQYVLQSAVPKEFRDIAILWNDEATQAMYTALDPKQATVHVSQWLSVQKFAQEFPEYDYVWNWEMDARVTGHNYDILEKLSTFAKQQPRRGLWERNERFYIPAVHGEYDTDFREEVEQRSRGVGIWGAPELPFVKPVGPHPPTSRPEDDDYEWGVGEEADLITLSPIFNPKQSGWVAVDEIWGYNDSSHATKDLPRRATIITHSRLSKRLLDVMHIENLRGNHASSEMATQTTAFLHGLKAVYAPIPVWFDRAWKGKDLAKWFNPGPNGTAGGHGCAMAWGQEGRYAGSTWYFRADPPQRLYLNWMGWEDTGIGGPDWEEEHGRPCLPPMIMHPVKDIEPTEPGYKSESKLPYD